MEKQHKRYELRNVRSFTKRVSAQVVVDELTRIERAHGEITPELVVEAARSSDAPLHPVFEWNQAQAAKQYRIIQARNLIRAVHVVSEDGVDQGAIFVHVAVEEAYCSIARVVSNEALFASAMEELQVKLMGAAKAVRDLEAAAVARPSEVRRRLCRARKHAEAASQALAARTTKRRGPRRKS